MRIGASILLIAVGAALKWAVTYRTSSVNIPVVGTILLVVGVIGLVITLILWASNRGDGYVESGGPEL